MSSIPIKQQTSVPPSISGRNFNQSQTSGSQQVMSGRTGGASHQKQGSFQKRQNSVSVKQQMIKHQDTSSLSLHTDKPQANHQNNRFRIAQLHQPNVDVSSRYWDQISTHNRHKLAPITQKSSALQTLDHSQRLPLQQRREYNQLQQRTIDPQATTSDFDFKRSSAHTPIVANIPRNEFDQLQRPFSFLANVGGKETSHQLLTTKVDRNLLMQKARGKVNMQKAQTGADSQANGSTIDFVTFNQSKQVQEIAKKGKTIKALVELDQTRQAQITIFTEMNVDNHDFDIQERRKVQRAISAMQRPQSSFRSGKTSVPALSALGKPIGPIQNLAQRPVSGLPPTLSAKTLPQLIAGEQQKVLNPSEKQSNREFRVSEQSNRRPFSAKPQYIQGLDRPMSAQVRVPRGQHQTQEDIMDDDEDEDEEVMDEYVDLNMYDNRVNDAESFSQKIMNTRPATAYKKERNFDLPFPELFDRSERTFAATFAKYGDLSYYTPLQRIGSYMDFSARLKKKHLIDLIAYIKTSKKPLKPTDEEINEPEQASKDYLENCLFIGVMPEEENPRAVKNTLEHFEKMDEMREIELARERVFDSTNMKFEGAFQYEKVWSETLMNQVQLSIHRFFKYIESPDAIRNEEISKYQKEWMSHALDLVPDTLLSRYQVQARALFSEVFTSFARAMRQAIMEYILRSPEERKRLHIVMLPRPVPTACERQLLRGGFSTIQYAGSHQRKLETENELKLRLLNNNLVTSALQSWHQEFRNFNLVELRNLTQFIETDTGEPGTAQYAMDVDSFLAFQEQHRLKVLNVMKHIWHRGCMTIIKKFKYLKLKEQQQQLTKGKASQAKWTFKGFQTRPVDHEDSYQRSFIEDFKWQEVEKFNFTEVLGSQTAMQRYFTRTGATHHNVHLNYFLIEDGFEVGAIPEDYRDYLDLDSLLDIRENSAYLAFVSMIGGYVNFDENGYSILTKEYKRELKYSAGNIMKLHLRDLVDRACATLKNYFEGFVTYKQIMKMVKPLRTFRIFVTKEWVSTKKRLEEERKRQQELEARKNVPLSKYEEVQMKKKNSASIHSHVETSKKSHNVWEQPAILQVPDFYDFQDWVQPVLRLDLTLVSSTPALLSQSQTQMSETKMSQMQQGDSLEFTKRESDIIEDFDAYLYRVFSSFNEYLPRPEFSKVKVVSQKRYEGDLEEEARLKKLNIKVKEATAFPSPGRKQVSQQPSFMGGLPNQTGMSNMTGFGNQQHLTRARQLEQALYAHNEDGSAVYRKYIGRIQIQESDKLTKDLIDENQTGVYAKPYVEKHYTIADPDQEGCYLNVRDMVRKTLKRHLKEARRVTEFYTQLEPLIQGVLTKKVRDFIQEERKDAQYEQLIKELRYYEKLSSQLPSIVFFPMFEIGTSAVKEELQRRVKTLISIVFKKFESTMAVRSQTICDKYQQICKYLDKQLKSPHDVVDMERFKNNLLLEIGTLQEKTHENRKAAFFLLHLDKVYEEETWTLLKLLYEWPDKLNAHMDQCDDRHRQERMNIEAHVQKKKDVFDENLDKLDEAIKEVQQWGDMQSYRLVINKVIDYQAMLDNYEEQMVEISQEEMMLFGFKSNFDMFGKVKDFYQPYYELWTMVSEVMVKKRKWLEAQLSVIDPDEVEQMVKQSLKSLIRLQKQLKSNANAVKVAQQLQIEVQDLSEWLPTIKVLCNPYLQPSHWLLIQQVAKANFNYKDISLNEVKYFNIKDFLPELTRISDQATQEANQDMSPGIHSSQQEEEQHSSEDYGSQDNEDKEGENNDDDLDLDLDEPPSQSQQMDQESDKEPELDLDQVDDPDLTQPMVMGDVQIGEQ